jgi:lantibiotic biosynthesis protein
MSDPSTELLVECALGIGTRICRNALWYCERSNWLGASAEQIFGRLHVVQRTFGPELYSGTAGIALVLGDLHSISPDPIFKKTAIGAITNAFECLHQLDERFSIGAFSGLSGIAYVGLRLGIKFDRPDWVEKSLKILDEQITTNLEHAAQIDVVMGAAGAIPIVIAAGKKFRMPALLEKAELLGKAVINCGVRSDRGTSWRTYGVEAGAHGLTGFSHGAAGIAWALLELFLLTRRTEYRTAAFDAFQYERYWFDSERLNWPDLRSGEVTSASDATNLLSGIAWCHGAPGIGLSRARAYEIEPNEALKSEAIAATETTVRSLLNWQSEKDSFCLCHGAGGNCELLVQMARVFGERALMEVARAVAHRAVGEHAPGSAWRSGVMDASPTPGLMLGDAGIAHALLRISECPNIGPVLLLIPDQLFPDEEY